MNNSNEYIISNSYDFFEHLLQDIDQAKETIDLETYIFGSDAMGIRIADALGKAAQRDVKVRVLVDGAGSPAWGDIMTRKLEKAGVETRIYHPFPWRFWQWSRSRVRVSTLKKAIYLCLNINRRNHRKVCIIDSKIGYVGSLNICQSHVDKDIWGDYWRDTAVRLQNINFNELKFAFDAAWDHMPIQERVREIFRNVQKNPIFRVNNTRHRRRILYKNLLRQINRSRERIWITNAYFVPDSFLLNKLSSAAQRGVDVRILLPERSDIFIMPWASATFYYNLVKSGVRIFEYLPSMLHAKTLIIDDWVSVGSTNLNYRSLLHDLEIDVNIRLPESKQIVSEQFKQDLANSREVALDSWQKRPYYQRIIGQSLLYLKYWI